jgi:colanic acid biosynthesis glycosyl transferase WcaI
MRFHPDLTGTGPLVTDLAQDLVSVGDEVSVVTSMPHYGRKGIPAGYKGKLIHRSTSHGVEVLRTWVYVPPSPRGFYRAVNYLSYTFMSVVAGILCDRPDVILCVNPPITVGFSGWVVSVIRHAPMVFNVQDVWPDCLEIIGQVRNPILIRIFRWLETFIYGISARITVLSQGMKQNLIEKGVDEEKIAVIPNWADVSYIEPCARNNGFRRTHDLGDRFLIMFAGNLGYISVLEMVLEAARLLKNDPDILFLIVGEGNAKRSLLERARALDLHNVRFLPTQPREVLPQMLGAADLALVTLDRRLGLLNVPSKIYPIMASSRPVLAAVPEDSEIAHLVKRTGCGVWVPPEDPSALVIAIRALSRDRELLEELGARGREHAVSQYSRQRITKKYHDLLREVARTCSLR